MSIVCARAPLAALEHDRAQPHLREQEHREQAAGDSNNSEAVSPTYGFGQPATAGDLARFYSSLPDGRDLPKGSGTVAQGKVLYEAQCLACHGDNLQGGLGDGLIGGRGTLVNSDPAKAPVKTVESYWHYATTLFDYIKRAMPLTAPESLSDDEVYGLCAYILSRANVVGADATMDAKSLAAVRMPTGTTSSLIHDLRNSRLSPSHRTRPRRSLRPNELAGRAGYARSASRRATHASSAASSA